MTKFDSKTPTERGIYGVCHSSNPVRGWLFIEEAHYERSLFCFSAARPMLRCATTIRVNGRAAEKQKRKLVGVHLAINRQPLTGFGLAPFWTATCNDPLLEPTVLR
jgi:hypothetical protein